jgi:hypothetical protein
MQADCEQRVAASEHARHGSRVRFFWRSDAHPLASYSSWVDQLDDKNRRLGTCAPTLAAVWSGPIDLIGALATHPALASLSVQRVTI